MTRGRYSSTAKFVSWVILRRVTLIIFFSLRLVLPSSQTCTPCFSSFLITTTNTHRGSRRQEENHRALIKSFGRALGTSFGKVSILSAQRAASAGECFISTGLNGT